MSEKVSLSELLYNPHYQSDSFVSYQDYFPSLGETNRMKLPEGEEYDSTASHVHTHLDSVTSEKDDYVDAEEKLQHIYEVVEQAPSILSLQNAKKLPLQKEKLLLNHGEQAYFNLSRLDGNNFDSQSYILPIKDAMFVSSFKKDHSRFESTKDQILKYEKEQEKAKIYAEKSKRTLRIRSLHKQYQLQIAGLQQILRSLGIRLDNRFYASNHLNVKNIPIPNLDMLTLKQEEPDFYQVMQRLQQLKIAFSFIPTATPIMRPRYSSPFGWRKDPFTRRTKFHSGTDFAHPTGTSIYAPASGIVRFAGYKNGYGKIIEIYHGNGITTRYGHLSRFFVKQGDKIMKSARIAAVGSTGRSTGSHLHYEILRGSKFMNPTIFMQKNRKIEYIILKK